MDGVILYLVIATELYPEEFNYSHVVKSLSQSSVEDYVRDNALEIQSAYEVKRFTQSMVSEVFPNPMPGSVITQLESSDAWFARITEELINILIDQKIITLDQFAEAARDKLKKRADMRVELAKPS